MGKASNNKCSKSSKLMISVSVISLFTMGASGGALAQDIGQKDSAGSTPDIVVTGTRVVRDGYEAPTPTSVIGAVQIAAKAPANLADFVNELPSMAATSTPRSNVGFLSTGQVGINALNLRNLGASRTLVLLDGQRVGSSTLTGLVDTNTFPQGLVKRVDVVTGGASAGWGSDAVAGVVNFILDKDFKGLKGDVQGGVTTYGDDRNWKVSLTGGASFADDRGHILVNVEAAYIQGINGIGKRRWYNGAKLINNPNYTAANGQPALLALTGVGFATATPGGIITSGPLRGTYFGPGGTPAQLNYGPIVSGNFMQGGDWQYSGDEFSQSGDLDPRLTRQNAFARVSYDLTEHLSVFAQGSYGRATSRQGSLEQFQFANLTIQPDNAFIPASIQGSVTAPFTLGTFNSDIGPIVGTSKREMYRGVLGAGGDVDAFGSNWTWDVYGQRTVNRVYTDARIAITANYRNAIDAVRNPATGAIVCRSTLTNPNNGCVPYNLFGTGVNGAAALNYVLGTSWGRNKLTQDVYAGTLRGEPFSTWAGPVSIAAGIEHRREKVSGTQDPLRTAAAASGQAPPYFAGNFLASFGSYNVTEGFLEAVVPLAKDAPWAENLDFNGAVRATDYSSVGYVTTWKLGLTYSPVSDVTFRVTRSRDIRAPNLAELYQTNQTSTTSITDPLRGNASTTIAQVTQGNLGLDPEKSDAWGLGVVLKPRFLPGFGASVDFYRLHIKDAVSTPNAQTVVNQCAQGNTLFCSQIARNAAGVITQTTVQPVNLAKQIAKGLDFEMSYRSNLFGGDLLLRGLATRYLKNYSADGITAPVDTVGTNGLNGTARTSLPKWRYLASIGWDKDPLSLTLTARGFSAGVYNTSYIECTTACPTSTPANMTINDNNLPGAIYFDTNVTFKLFENVDVYLAVDNIANRSPYQMAFGPAIGTAPLSVNPLLWDVLGRSFRVGARFRM